MQLAQVAMIFPKICCLCGGTRTLPSLTRVVISSTGSGISEVNVDMRSVSPCFSFFSGQAGGVRIVNSKPS